MTSSDVHKIEEYRAARRQSAVDISGDGPHNPGMEERLSRVEIAVARLGEAVAGIRHSQTILIAAISLVGAILAGIQIYTLNRVDALPEQINDNLRDLTNTLANSITAARSGSQQPIIIQVPAQPQEEQPSPPQQPQQ